MTVTLGAAPQATDAYHLIRRAIVEGAYPPGQRLVEQRLAEEHGLSRTPVREALRMLQAEGLVDFERNRGAAVRRLTVDDIADIYELRSRLEGYACERAAVRATDDQIDRMRVAADRFAAHVDTLAEVTAVGSAQPAPGLFHDLTRWNDELHLTILEAASNERLTTTLFRTVDHPLVFQAFRRYDHGQLGRSALFHRLIQQALAAREGDRASRLMAEHVLQGRDVLLEAVREHAGGDADAQPEP